MVNSLPRGDAGRKGSRCELGWTPSRGLPERNPEGTSGCSGQLAGSVQGRLCPAARAGHLCPSCWTEGVIWDRVKEDGRGESEPRWGQAAGSGALCGWGPPAGAHRWLRRCCIGGQGLELQEVQSPGWYAVWCVSTQGRRRLLVPRCSCCAVRWCVREGVSRLPSTGAAARRGVATGPGPSRLSTPSGVSRAASSVLPPRPPPVCGPVAVSRPQ